MSMIAAIIGRILLAALFILSGIQKVLAPEAAAQALEAANLSPTLALPTGLFEIIAGVLLAVGLMSRLVAIVLFGFVALTILFFHNQFTDPVQGALASKNVAIMGGLLMVFAYGQMRGSYDHLRMTRREHKAQIRAAHAEGVAEGAAHGGHTVVTDADGHPVAETRRKRRWF
jgi:putative oxidoreductase